MALVDIEEKFPGPNPGGSDGGDPCAPCTTDPNGPQGFCDSQPGGDTGVPQGCAVDTDVEIIEACDTDGEHPALEDVDVQAMMTHIWEESYGTESNPLPHDQRNEAAFLIVATSDGYETQIIPAQDGTTSCHFNGGNFDIPSNIVAFVHTHPYGDGDPVNDPRCEDRPYYDGDNVSDADENLMQSLNQALPYNIPFFVMDKDKIRVMKPSNPSQYDENLDRCGYIIIS